VLLQSADKLTGTFGKFDWPVIGAMDGSTVVFTFVAHATDRNGKEVSDTVFYWGTIDASSKTMKGRMKNPGSLLKKCQRPTLHGSRAIDSSL
jgi:hypothetical protein